MELTGTGVPSLEVLFLLPFGRPRFRLAEDPVSSACNPCEVDGKLAASLI